MSTVDGVKFDIIRPKKETRKPAKKRVTVDTNISVKSQRQNESKSEAKDDKKDKKGGKSPKSSLPPLDDDSDNQGFTEWLRSSDGVDMMRLFVIANSLLVLITMAWPHMQQSFGIIRELIFGEED